MDYENTVLLVEDNAELNEANARVLRMRGYNVHPALTLTEARDWLQNNYADIILLDVMLPDGDGIDFCAEIRQPPLRILAHILFLTAKTNHEDRVRGLANGGDDYITKPFHPEEILARVEAAMRRRKMSDKTPQGTPDPIDPADKKFHSFAKSYALTEKESEALFHILQKQSIKDIAEVMGISDKGVEFHITNILSKTALKQRREVLHLYAHWKKYPRYTT